MTYTTTWYVSPVFECAGVASSSLTVPTTTILNIFRYAASNRNLQGYQTFGRGRSRSLIRYYVEFALVKLRHNTHVECRILVYGGRFSNIESEDHRADYVYEDINWQGEIQCNVVLISDCQATQEFLSRTTPPQAGSRPPMELATFIQRANMRSILSQWLPEKPRTS
jgi:hypothetical protein